MSDETEDVPSARKGFLITTKVRKFSQIEYSKEIFIFMETSKTYTAYAKIGKNKTGLFLGV